jgi:hypothetical protein
LISGHGVGREKLAIPNRVPRRHIATPTGFSARASPGGLVATWDYFYGAFAYDVKVHI